MKLLVLFLLGASLAAGQSLFDGKSLKGWSVQEKEAWMWKVKDGAIVGGSLEKKVPHNTFITTERRYKDFELTLQVKVVGKKPNAGIQIRSERIKDHHEMIGYQADVGPGWWGKLYDESRRRKVMGNWVSKEAAQAAKEGWNDYKIRCEGKRIRLWINDILTCDYTEKDESIPLEGYIALQAHSGPPFEASYRKIVIKEL
jgi:ribosomal protein S6E (S10)